MEEIIEQFDSALADDCKEEPKSDFEGLYKNWGKLGNQEQRRRDLLETQKTNRKSKLDTFRGILELVEAVEQNDIFKSQKSYYRPRIYVAGFNKASLTYNNVLMMSEWMIEKPEDLVENWFLVPCPVGVRMLVVATQGTTKCYTKYGHFRFQRNTALPGGGKPVRTRQCCVLDCFYDEKLNTMHILDLLAWNSHAMTDGETEFRHYWLETQLQEMPELTQISNKNQIIFKIIPKISCTPDSLQEFMLKYPPFEQDHPSLDGLLFYHKRSHYISGQTPLVGWLYPYMVPELLGSEIRINENYEKQKPADYVNQAQFIQEFEAKAKKKAARRSKKNSTSMDTAEEPKEKTDPSKPVDAEITEDAEKTDKKSESMEEETVLQESVKKTENTENKSESMEEETVLQESQKKPENKPMEAEVVPPTET